MNHVHKLRQVHSSVDTFMSSLTLMAGLWGPMDYSWLDLLKMPCSREFLVWVTRQKKKIKCKTGSACCNNIKVECTFVSMCSSWIQKWVCQTAWKAIAVWYNCLFEHMDLTLVINTAVLSYQWTVQGLISGVNEKKPRGQLTQQENWSS